jgi:hypothetical protein
MWWCGCVNWLLRAEERIDVVANVLVELMMAVAFRYHFCISNLIVFAVCAQSEACVYYDVMGEGNELEISDILNCHFYVSDSIMFIVCASSELHL